MKLKYLFVAKFTDGTVYKQSEDDVSLQDPKRSAFYDVLQINKPIKEFHLKRWFDNWSVDLETGVFTHNRKQFQLEENPKGKRKLEFFRQHQHDMSRDGKEIGHRVIYFLGYSVGDRKFIVGIK